MAHSKSALKRMRNNERNRQRNMAVTSRMKTYVKAATKAIDSKDADKVKTAVPAAIAEIDKAVSKGVLHANAAARKKSTLRRLARTVD